jgi:hypothetical protein
VRGLSSDGFGSDLLGNRGNPRIRIKLRPAPRRATHQRGNCWLRKVLLSMPAGANKLGISYATLMLGRRQRISAQFPPRFDTTISRPALPYHCDAAPAPQAPLSGLQRIEAARIISDSFLPPADTLPQQHRLPRVERLNRVACSVKLIASCGFTVQFRRKGNDLPNGTTLQDICLFPLGRASSIRFASDDQNQNSSSRVKLAYSERDFPSFLSLFRGLSRCSRSGGRFFSPRL